MEKERFINFEGLTFDDILLVPKKSAILPRKVDVIVIDTAHGHSTRVVEVIKEIKQTFNIELIGGNVATFDGAESLIKAGVDAIKVGIGPGSIVLREWLLA